MLWAIKLSWIFDWLFFFLLLVKESEKEKEKRSIFSNKKNVLTNRQGQKKRPLGRAHEDDDSDGDHRDEPNKNSSKKRPRRTQPISDLNEEEIVNSDGNPKDLQSDDESCKFSSLHKFVPPPCCENNFAFSTKTKSTP